MRSGLDRRDETAVALGARDNLRGRDAFAPIETGDQINLRSQKGPRVGGVSAPTQRIAGVQNEVWDQLYEWGGKRAREAAAEKYNKDFLEGQMAYQQGVAFEQIETGGNKWALEGYRVMAAQTASSELLAAQIEEIRLNGHQMDPDTFRAQWAARVEETLKGKDERTQDLIREQAVGHLPRLVEEHTALHARWAEQQNYDALTEAVDVTSRDPGNIENLRSFIQGGPGSASEGLSEDRRRAAVVDGVVRAFGNDNPHAYANVFGQGMMDPNNLSAEESSKIESARQAFMNRRRRDGDVQLTARVGEIEEQVRLGNLNYLDGVAELAAAYADYDIEIQSQDMGAVFSIAQNVERTENQTRGVQLEEASLRRDFDSMANITVGVIEMIESGGREVQGPLVTGGANAGDRAQGRMQVMPKTLKNPGFGIRPSDGSPEDNARVGREYWSMLVRRYNGDLELAAMAYNAGPGNVDYYIENGHWRQGVDVNQVETYRRRFVSELERQSGVTPATRLQRAEEMLRQTSERLGVERYENYARGREQAEQAYRAGELTSDQFRQTLEAQRRLWQQETSKADIEYELSVTRDIIQQAERLAARQAEIDQTNQYSVQLEGFKTAAAELDRDVEASINSIPGIVSVLPVEEQAAAAETLLNRIREGYTNDRNALADEFGIPLHDTGFGQSQDRFLQNARAMLLEAERVRENTLLADTAIEFGTLDKADKEVQELAYRRALEQANQFASDRVEATQGSDDPANYYEEYSSFMEDWYAQSGHVPKQVRDRLTAMVMQDDLTRDGLLNEEKVAAVIDYARMRDKNPTVAARMLEDEGVAEAEEILARAGGNIGAIQNVIGNRGRGIEYQGDVEELLVRPDIRKGIDRAVRETSGDIVVSLFDVALTDRTFGEWYSNQNRQARDNIDQNRAIVEGEIRTELENLLRSNPHSNPRFLAQEAQRRVEARSMVIGGQLIVTPRGSTRNIYEDMFGGAAHQFQNNPGIPNEVIRNYVNTPEFREAHPHIVEAPGLIEWLTDPQGANASRMYGANPFIATYNNGVLSLQFNLYEGMMPDWFTDLVGADYSEGISAPITIPLREAGELYMQRRRREVTRGR